MRLPWDLLLLLGGFAAADFCALRRVWANPTNREAGSKYIPGGHGHGHEGSGGQGQGYRVRLPGERTRSVFFFLLASALTLRVLSLVAILTNAALYATAESLLITLPRSFAGSISSATSDKDLDAAADANANLPNAETSRLWEGPKEGSGRSLWLTIFLLQAPSLLFITCYTIVIKFWSQILYTARFVLHPRLPTWFLTFNLSLYLVVMVFGTLTFVLHSATAYKVCFSLVLGLAYAFVAVAFAVLGFRVSLQFASDGDDRARDARKTAVVRRVLLLSLLLPLLFALRAAFEVASTFALLPPMVTRNAPMAINALLAASELLPAVCILVAFAPAPKGAGGDTEARARLSGARAAYLAGEGVDDPGYTEGRGSESFPLPGALDSLKMPLMASQPQNRVDCNSNDPDSLLLNFAPHKVYPIGHT